MIFERLKTNHHVPCEPMPNFIETVYQSAINRLNDGILEAIKSKIIECGFRPFDSESSFRLFLKDHITMCNFESGELSELWYDYGLPTARIICTMKNDYNIEFNEGKITLTYE